MFTQWKTDLDFDRQCPMATIEAMDREFEAMVKSLPSRPFEDVPDLAAVLSPVRERFPELVFRAVEISNINDILTALRGVREGA